MTLEQVLIWKEKAKACAVEREKYIDADLDAYDIVSEAIKTYISKKRRSFHSDTLGVNGNYWFVYNKLHDFLDKKYGHRIITSEALGKGEDIFHGENVF